jgi:hypothetical protein
MHEHAWPGSPLVCHPLGESACLTPVSRDGGRIGYLFAHVRGDPTGPWCTGYISVVPQEGRAVWEATGSLEDGTLTLSPSLHCTRDGFHGFVRGGQWVPA